MFRILIDLFFEKNIIFMVFVNWYCIFWIKEFWYIINFNVLESLMIKCNFSLVLNLFYIINVVWDILWIMKYVLVLFLYKNIFVYILIEIVYFKWVKLIKFLSLYYIDSVYNYLF